MTKIYHFYILNLILGMEQRPRRDFKQKEEQEWQAELFKINQEAFEMDISQG